MIVGGSNLKGFVKLFNIPVLAPHVLGAEPDDVVDQLSEIAELDGAGFRDEPSDGDLVEFGLSVAVLVFFDFFIFGIIKLLAALDVVKGFAVLLHDIDELGNFRVGFGDGGEMLIDKPEDGLLGFLFLNL